MPQRKKPEPKGASTPRSRRFRVRKRQRDLIAEHDSLIALDLQQHYATNSFCRDLWVPAKSFFAERYPAHANLLLGREIGGVEAATALIFGSSIKLIRPKFLPDLERKPA
jgi:hypothetical protein